MSVMKEKSFEAFFHQAGQEDVGGALHFPESKDCPQDHGVAQYSKEQSQAEKNIMNLKTIIMEQAAWNKSSLLLKSIFRDTQTLQLITKIIKTESI
jgi:hypothetical protein